LTKTKAQGRPRKTKLVEDLRGAADEYKHIYVFKFENMRATVFKDIRMHFKESKIFMGKNKLAQVALGRSTEDEFKDNLMSLSQVSWLTTPPNQDCNAVIDSSEHIITTSVHCLPCRC
jgi:mRNA turnover protein 4